MAIDRKTISRLKKKRDAAKKKTATATGPDAPFRVLSSPYQTQGDFDTAVQNNVNSQLDPLLDDWESRRKTETQSHTGRVADIQGIYNAGDAARKAALDRTSGALNSLITLNSGLSGGTRDAMAAALRGGQDREAAVAQQLGVASTPGQGQQYQDATQASIDLAGLGTTGEFASILGGLGRDIGINEVGRQEAGRQEGSRWDDVMSSLTGEKSDLEGRRPGLMQTARESLMTTELQRQAQREQQRLGRAQEQLNEDQFGEQKVQNREQRRLSRAQQREAERQGRSDRSLGRGQLKETERSNRANESINQDQIEAQKAKDKEALDAATDQTQIEELKAKGERFANGVKILSDYFKPTKGETAKSGKSRKSYEQRVTNGYDSMVNQLMSATGAGPVEARRMILAAVNEGTAWGKRWVTRARQEIRAIKNARVYQKPGTPGASPAAPLGPK